MRLGNRALILLFLLIDLLLLSLSLAIVAKLHYNEWLEFNNLFFLLNGIWIATYIFYLDLAFFDIQNTGKRTQSLLRKFFVYVSLGAILIVLFNMDDISRIMFLGSSLGFLVLKISGYLFIYLFNF